MRLSTRSYDKNKRISKENIKEIGDFADQFKIGLNKEKVNFFLIEDSIYKKEKVRIGTCGAIDNSPAFIVGKIETGDLSYLSYGYLFEHIILKITDLGLSTCWLGYFDSQILCSSIQLFNNEVIPAISPVGYKKFNLFNPTFFVKDILGIKKRKSIDEIFFEGDFSFPIEFSHSNPYFIVLKMVRLAPSSGNKQPWRILKEKNRFIFHFFLDLSGYPEQYIQKKLYYLDMGIAMCHFELTAREYGLKGDWEYMSNTINLEFKHFKYIVTWIG